jgi:SAM-dependent methyltransferase
MPQIKWGTHTRTVLDVGCGVASFGGYLLDRNVITMSFAPKDEHEAQIQFALERGIPALLAVIGTQKLPFPDNAFDVIHCARCRVHWYADGKYFEPFLLLYLILVLPLLIFNYGSLLFGERNLLLGS